MGLRARLPGISCLLSQAGSLSDVIKAHRADIVVSVVPGVHVTGDDESQVAAALAAVRTADIVVLAVVCAVSLTIFLSPLHF